MTRFRIVMIVAALVLLVGVILYSRHMMQAQSNRPMPPAKSEQVQRADVRVVNVQAAAYQAKVSAYGAAEPRFSLSLNAEVSGRAAKLSDQFATGLRVKAGELLLQLEDSDYRAALASAELDLANARLALLEEERQGKQARAEWKASGLKGEPDSELVLRGPQLAAAKAAVSEAQAALASAREDLAQTRITAPFDALVVERQVAPGSYVQAGSELATLYSTDRVEISVALSERDWSNLPDLEALTAGDWPARLQNLDGSQQWQASVTRAEQHLDETTRQRALIIALEQPLDASPPLLPGSFLAAEVQGTEVDGLWRLPNSALSQRGEIWYLTADNELANFEAQPLFADAEAIYVRPPQTLIGDGATQRVVVHPLSSYLQGTLVNPVEDSGNE